MRLWEDSPKGYADAVLAGLRRQCPWCRAQPGHWCTSKHGRLSVQMHDHRMPERPREDDR